jgi:large subunit ribosomal protein L24
MMKIRKGDEVIVTTGKDKGKRGTVLRMLLVEEKLVVEGVNRVKRHTRPNPMKNQQGGIVEKEMPIHLSNVALFNAKTGKGDKVGIKMLDDGRRVRVFKSNGEQVDAK